MTTQRRGFLKLGATILGALTLTKYAEPLLAMETFNDWVEDKGDFFIVRVPDFKTFAKETFDKPTIFLLGQQSIVRSVSVIGFANISSPNGASITDCSFDSSKMTTENDRPALLIKGSNTICNSINCLTNGNTALGFISLYEKPILSLGDVENKK